MDHFVFVDTETTGFRTRWPRTASGDEPVPNGASPGGTTERSAASANPAMPPALRLWRSGPERPSACRSAALPAWPKPFAGLALARGHRLRPVDGRVVGRWWISLAFPSEKVQNAKHCKKSVWLPGTLSNPGEARGLPGRTWTSCFLARGKGQ